MANSVNTGGTEPGNESSDTRFGLSVESEAQRADLAREASTLAGEPVGELKIFRLVPTAAADDPRWQGATSQGEVLVCARTSGDARIVAAANELDFMEIDSAPAGDVTTTHASMFRDDKLYTVIQEGDGRGLQRGVIEGNIRVDAIRPTQT